MPEPVDLYRWRVAVMSEAGPANPLARVVLMAISLHMKPDGTGAWPAQSLIAKRAAVGLRSVKRHLEIAERLGWLERTLVRVAGKTWRRTEYGACVPDVVYESLPERPWEEDPMWSRGATAAPRCGAKGSKTRSKVPIAPEQGAAGAERGANGTEQGATGDNNKVPQLGLLTLPLNSSSNSPNNSPSEGALACTAMAKKVTLEKTVQEKAAEASKERRDAIERFVRTDLEEADIVHMLQRYKVSLEEVRHVYFQVTGKRR